MITGIYTIGGTVQASGGYYIERAADAELLALCREGTFAYVLTARQLGKSSLVAHTAVRLAEEGVRPVVIDLTQLGTQLYAEQWYLGLLAKIADELLLDTDPLAWWQERAHLGLTQRLTDFLHDVVLAEVAAPVVIFVDEIDTTLSLDFTDDFYAAIRALYNQRAQRPALRRLAFVLIGVAMPGDLIKDPQRTPFNIGRQVNLTDFTAAEARPFAGGLSLPDEAAERVIDRVLYWTGGHPYLTQRLCGAIAGQPGTAWDEAAIDVLVRDLFLGEKSRQDNNLLFVRDMLTRRAPDPAGVLTTYRAVLRGRVVPDDERSLVKAHLKLAGAVRREGAALRVRNRIYAAVFDAAWVAEHLPREYWGRRVRRFALVAIAALAALALLLGLFLVGANSRNQELQEQQATAVAGQATAEQARAEAVAARQTAEAARSEADARRLAVLADSLRVAESQTALRLAAEASLRSDNLETNTVLRAALDQPLWRATLQGHTGWVNSAAFSPDGQRIVTASRDQTARVWDRDGQPLATLQGHTGPVSSAAFSPDGQRIVTASLDGTARVWDRDGQPLATLTGNTSSVTSAAFSPDGQRIVTASGDQTARVWDRDGQPLATLQGHTDWVSGAAFSPDGQRIVTASRDQTARVYLACTADLLWLAACSLERGEFTEAERQRFDITAPRFDKRRYACPPPFAGAGGR